MISAIETGGIGAYNIIESIGQGGFSEYFVNFIKIIWFLFLFFYYYTHTPLIFRVFRAMNTQTGELVAIKQIKSTSSPDEQSRSKEILIHKHLQHGNIIKFIESFVEEKEGLVFIVQELADGGELFEHVEPDTGFSEQVAHFYFVQMIRAIVCVCFIVLLFIFMLFLFYSILLILSLLSEISSQDRSVSSRFKVGKFIA